MKHSEIVREIYERHKERLKSENQVEFILLSSFRTFKTLVTKGQQFCFPQLFFFKFGKETWQIMNAKRKKENIHKAKWARDSNRIWTKQIIDKDF